MEMDERIEKDGEVTETLPAVANEPVAPKAMSIEEVQEAQRRAEELVKELGAATGGKAMELLDGITHVGLQAQRDAAGPLDLLKSKMGAFLDEGGSSRDIAKGLRDLRVTLEQINPNDLQKPGIRARVLAVMPFLRERYNPMARTLRKIAIRYEPVSEQVAVIETRLRDGQSLLAHDNVELRMLFEEVEGQQPPIQHNVYLGELLMQHLTVLMEQAEDPVRRDRIQSALHDVAVRIQDLKMMEEVHVQYLVSIEMSRDNNNRLGQSVERTLALATNVVTVGLAIQGALVHQRRVATAAKRTREFLGDLIVANATAINRHTKEIGDLYNQPVIAMEKVSKAHEELVEALDTASWLRQEGIVAAQDNLAKLRELTAGLEQRIGGAAQDADGSAPAAERSLTA